MRTLIKRLAILFVVSAFLCVGTYLISQIDNKDLGFGDDDQVTVPVDMGEGAPQGDDLNTEDTGDDNDADDGDGEGALSAIESDEDDEALAMPEPELTTREMIDELAEAGEVDELAQYIVDQNLERSDVSDLWRKMETLMAFTEISASEGRNTRYSALAENGWELPEGVEAESAILRMRAAQKLAGLVANYGDMVSNLEVAIQSLEGEDGSTDDAATDNPFEGTGEDQINIGDAEMIPVEPTSPFEGSDVDSIPVPGS